MSNKHKNPYRGNYGRIFGYWKTKQVVTEREMNEFAVKELGMEEKAAKASVTVIMSPRKSNEECRGDCRGNMSAKGHLYYGDILKHEKGEEKRFRLRYRETPLEPRKRVKKVVIESEKVEKVEEVEVIKNEENELVKTGIEIEE